MTIGATIIVKNESKYLENCLRQIYSKLDQIVVVDTGSEDNSAVIAAKYGADIYFHNWTNDFSDARNFAISHCRTDWIISIDADEEVVINTFPTDFHDLLNEPKIGGINVILNNYLSEDLQTAKQHRFTRIFRNNKNIRFNGKIHEQIAESIIEIGFEIYESDIIFNHYGYIGKDLNKSERNKILLESAIQEDNSDIFMLYHLANTEFSIGNDSKTEEIFLQLKDNPNLTDAQNNEVKLKLAQIYLKQNRFSEIEPILNFHCDNIDSEGLRLSILAAAMLNMQNFSRARELYSMPEIRSSKLVDISTIEKAMKIFEILNNI